MKTWITRLPIAVLFCALLTMPLCADEVAGSWTGSWRSCSSGHKGPLNATICKVNDDCYRANFSGRFFKFFPFKYSVTLNVVERNGETVRLSGSSYLGRLMGWFHYDATIENGCLNAHYRSCKDRGVWQLKKCCP